ncbi:MAG TPA: retropepsin-like aspartic protease, partial [Thermoanaerobaculia bacterium]|nr:retropepsin-like aspartic protease [Thermoanaerobaculia bacterium]
MKALPLAVATCLLAGLAASAQEPQTQQVRVRPRPYATAEVPAAAVELPMLEGPLAIVEVRVNGQGPFRFGVDTGAAGGARISQTLVDKLGLQAVGQAMTGDPSGKSRRTIQVFEIDQLKVGDAVFGKVPAAAGDYSAVGVDGILGNGLFSEYLLTLDYPRRRVRIERGELPPADNKTILGFEAPQGIPTVHLRLGEVDAEAHVDSGNSRQEIVVPASLIPRLKLAAEPVPAGKGRTLFNEFEIQQAPLAGNLVLGSYELSNPKID